jgi:WASH complex subunit CCDC53
MQTPIDFKTVDSLPQRKTITLVNNFIINTTQFLNKFSYLCEEKLADVSHQIEKLEITLNILEAKLASIPGLDPVNIPEPTSTDATVPVAPPSNSSDAPPPPPPPGSSSAPPPPPPPGSGNNGNTTNQI